MTWSITSAKWVGNWRICRGLLDVHRCRLLLRHPSLRRGHLCVNGTEDLNAVLKRLRKSTGARPPGTGWREACLREYARGADGQAAMRVKVFRPWGQRK